MTTQTADTDGVGSPGGNDTGWNPDTAIESGAQTAPMSVPVVSGQRVKRRRGGRIGPPRSGLLAQYTTSTGAR